MSERLNYYERPGFKRMLEIFPGALTWTLIILPIVLSLVKPVLVAYFIIAFDLFWLVKSLRLSFNLIRGYRTMHRYSLVDWNGRVADLNDLELAVKRRRQELEKLQREHPYVQDFWPSNLQKRGQRVRWLNARKHLQELEELADRPQTVLKPEDLYHAIILAEYNEPVDIMDATIEQVLASDYDKQKLIFVLAYEGRGSGEDKQNVKRLMEKHGSKFGHALLIEHPDGLPGEARAKGANITYAARRLTEFASKQGISPDHIIVTTLDADHRPSPHYFSYVTYMYATDPNRLHKSYQPVPMLYNNIWDAAAPMRVVASGGSFWILVQCMTPHLLRNFSAHAQGLQTLIDTDYWNVQSIVEDGHQYWRTFFAYDGDHQVVPIFAPIYQDAVIAARYGRTLKVQYIQLRRWAWGISDFAYATSNSLKYRSISWNKKVVELLRLLEGHISWATAPLLLSFVAWLPLLLNRRFNQTLLAHQLPVIASRILTLATLGLVTTVFISLISLPPRPPRYRRVRFINMTLQWALLPLVTIVFSAFPAIDAQTRLMLGKYLDFRVTEKRLVK